jgi:hypothetical protein
MAGAGVGGGADGWMSAKGWSMKVWTGGGRRSAGSAVVGASDRKECFQAFLLLISPNPISHNKYQS